MYQKLKSETESLFPQKSQRPHFSTDISVLGKMSSGIDKSKLLYYNMQVSPSPSPSSQSQGADPDDELGFRIPVPRHPHHHHHHSSSTTEVSTHWRTNFMVSSLPFLLWGFPTHLLFRRRRISSFGEWLRYLCPCSSPCISFFTVLMVVNSVVINAFFLYIFGYIFKALLITGIIDAAFYERLFDFIRTLPVVLPLNIFWLKGYHLRNFIASFDRFATHLRSTVATITTTTTTNQNQNEMGLKFSIPSCRPLLAILYLMITCMHTLHVVADMYDKDELVASSDLKDRLWSYAFGYSLAVMCTLLFPLYCVACWAIKSELLSLVEFIKTLIATGVPASYQHFDEVKRCYRKIADDIMMVNRLFSIYMTLVGFVLGTYIFSEVRAFSESIVKAFLPGVIGVVLNFVKKASAAAAAANAASEGGNVTTTAASNSTSGVVVPMQMTPFELRLLMADAFIMLFYLALFGITYWEAVKVNDEVRFLHVWLNDLVTEPPSRLTPELRGGYEMLKWYIHSRLEQERPALLDIMGLTLVPGLKRRLIQYRVFH